ncbi:MAG: TRAP transporter small permease [Nitrospinota bacterium]
MFARIDRWLVRLTGAAVVLLMVAMTVSILLGVFYRYILNSALTWPEELARYAMVWVACLGSSLALRSGDHVAVEFLVQRVPSRARRWVILGGRLLILVFLFLMVRYGSEMTARVSHQRSAAMELSMSVPYLAIPLGGTLMIYHLLVLMFRRKEERPHPLDLPAA